jgi:oligopeptidase B
MRSNRNSKNFNMMRTNVDNYTTKTSWEVFIEEDANKYLSSFDLTEEYLILNYQELGLPVSVVVNLATKLSKTIKFPDQAFTASAYSTNFQDNDIRVNYSSLSRPTTTYQYNFNHETLSVLKTQDIPSGFNPEEYQVERIFAKNDDINIPISLFYKKSLFKKDGSNPLYLYGYGSYGLSIPPSFRNNAVSLADRGFIYAIAHIRGGDDLGHDWYEAAKFLTKKRTFEDFIAASEALIEQKYTSVGNIVIVGGSAGGMLIGNVINQRPELYKAAIAHVPFVDVLNTMLDESLPLTAGEYKEWGNPQDKLYFDYIKSYCPYSNVAKQNYPHLFITSGLTDPRVGYWEGAKWAAKLRANKTDNNLLLSKTNMEFGHQGASGRFDYLKEIAEDLIFIFKAFGLINHI